MKKFEYKSFMNALTDKDLNKQGQEGWELVSHTAVSGGGHAVQYYIFKREIINK